MAGVAWELGERLGLVLRVPTQCMCACYEGDGAHYVAHRDNVCAPPPPPPPSSTSASDTGESQSKSSPTDPAGMSSSMGSDCHNSREVTAILYTSEGWSDDDGGCLRYWPLSPPHGGGGGGGGGGYEEVAPRAGTLVGPAPPAITS
jgi:hypothetical protein